MTRAADRPAAVGLGAWQRARAAFGGGSLRIDLDTANELIAQGAVLVDVRRTDDPGGSLAGAVRIPPDEIPSHLGAFSRDVPIVLACT